MQTTQVVTTVNGEAALLALRAEVQRVVAMLRSVTLPPGPRLGDWAAADVAMHLSQAWIAVPSLAAADLSPVRTVLPDLAPAGDSLIKGVWDLGDMTKAGVRADPERNLAALADRIETRAMDYFAHAPERAANRRPWLVEGIEVPFCVFTCHLLNETLMHGWDIATAAGRSWPIDPGHAAMALDGFVIPVIRALGPRDMVDQKEAAGLRANYELKLRGAGTHVFAFDDGALTIDPPTRPRIDCTVSADPTAMFLVVWNRRSQWPAIAKTQLMAYGRKPWLGFKFRSLMRNP